MSTDKDQEIIWKEGKLIWTLLIWEDMQGTSIMYLGGMHLLERGNEDGMLG